MQERSKFEFDPSIETVARWQKCLIMAINCQFEVICKLLNFRVGFKFANITVAI